jgi:GNAT superfamily N-acetyltransferase
LRRDDNPEIRLARVGDAEDITELFAAMEPGSVWARLGPRVSRIHWERYCHGAHEIAVTAWLDGNMVGFCLGTDRPRESARRLYIESGGALARAFAREVLSRPAVLLVVARRLVSALGRRLRRVEPPATGEDPFAREDTCYMANFFVSPAARGHQLGTRMLERFAHEMALRGSRWCVVHTTAENIASQVAQRRAGFECVRRQGDDVYFVRSLSP